MENYWDFNDDCIAPIYRTSEEYRLEILRNYSRHTLQVNTVCDMRTFLPILFETQFKVDQLPKTSCALLITNLYCAAYRIIGL